MTTTRRVAACSDALIAHAQRLARYKPGLNRSSITLLSVLVGAISMSACAHGGAQAVPDSQQRGTRVLRPIGQDPGGGPPIGSAYINTNCTASDATCAGPWQNGMPSDSWETAAVGGDGHFHSTLVCAGVDVCSLYGYANTIAHYNTVWTWNVRVGAPADAADLDVSYSDGCDVANNDQFPVGCLLKIATLGRKATQGATCLNASLAVGLVPGPGKPDVFANEIVQIDYVKAAGLGAKLNQVIGFIYHTPGDGLYFQPNFAVSVSGGIAVLQVGLTGGAPWVPIANASGAEITRALNQIASVAGAALPLTYMKVINSGVSFSALNCWDIPWDGTRLASVKRRT